MIYTIISYLGLMTVLLWSYRFGMMIHRNFFRKEKDLKQRYSGGKDTWAVVTGATAGIGLEFAH